MTRKEYREKRNKEAIKQNLAQPVFKQSHVLLGFCILLVIGIAVLVAVILG